MKTPLLIKSLVFSLVFLAVMSVSFLVEAHDIPDGVAALASTVQEMYGPMLPRAEQFPLSDVEDGMASWYGAEFHGRRTASGDVFNMHELTAAHRTLPFGTLLKVVNPLSGSVVVVEVTDRGPFVGRRVVDLSRAAAQRVGVSVSKVEMEALTPEHVEAFYANTADMVIVVTPDMDVQVREVSAIQGVIPATSYADAVKKARRDDVVIVLPDGIGGTVYSIGTSMPVELAVASGVGDSVSNTAN